MNSLRLCCSKENWWYLLQTHGFTLAMSVMLLVLAWQWPDVVGGPNDTFFIELDPEHSFPLRMAQEVPTWLLLVLVVGMPIPIFYAVFIFLRRQLSAIGASFEHSLLLNDLAAPFCAFFQAHGINFFLTVVVKVFVGRKRPNFFALCDYDGYREAIAQYQAGQDTLLKDYLLKQRIGMPGTLAKCRIEGGLLDESMMSFPSGHCSSAMCGMTMLFLMTVGMVHAARVRRRFGERSRYRVTLHVLWFTACSGLALYIASTRSRDNWHHAGDIAAGLMLGLCVAIFSFYTHFVLPGTRGARATDEALSTVIRSPADDEVTAA